MDGWSDRDRFMPSAILPAACFFQGKAMVHTGSCLCGKVRYRVDGPMRGIIYCHCTQCRKQFGHFCAATAAEDCDLTVEGGADLAWYRSSPDARRGFCSTCGSALFWKHDRRTSTSITAGSLDGPTGLKAGHHIFCASKGDYYEILDGLPQLAS